MVPTLSWFSHICLITDKVDDLFMIFGPSYLLFPFLPVYILWSFFHWNSCIFLIGFYDLFMFSGCHPLCILFFSFGCAGSLLLHVGFL